MNFNPKTMVATMLCVAATSAVWADGLRRVPDPARPYAETGLTNGEYNPRAIEVFGNYFRMLGAKGHGLERAEEGVRQLNIVRPRPDRVMRRSAYEPRGNMFAVVPNHENASSYNDAFFGSIDMTDGSVTPIYKGRVFSNAEEYDSQTGAVRGDILYIPQFLQNMVTSEIEVRWKRVDITTGSELDPITFGGNTNAYFYAMTYDSGNDRFLGLSMDIMSGGMGNLVEVKCGDGDWTVTPVGNVGGTQGNFMAGLAYCPADGNIYGLNDNGNLYTIDVDWGDSFKVKTFDEGNEYFMIPMYPYPMAFTYSPRDKALVTVYRDNVERRMLLGLVDLESLDAVEGNELSPICYVSSLYCPDAYAADEAPDLPVINSVSFNGPSLSGEITVTAPTETFAGEPLADEVQLTLMLNGTLWNMVSLVPGSSTTLPATLPEGLYRLSVTASIEASPEIVSAPANSTFYVGNDIPAAPSDLKWNDGLLTWTAPTVDGVNHGYVDVSALRYNVYVNGELQNAEPLAECSYAPVLPDVPERLSVSVTAEANGHVSAGSLPISHVIGNGFTLPVNFAPTRDESELFTTFNANGDTNEWKWGSENGETFFQIRTGFNFEKPEDWLFLPPVRFTSTENQYSLLMNYVNGYMDERHLDNLEVWIGTDSRPDKMDNLIYSHTDYCTPVPQELDVRFNIGKGGDYVIGIHATGGETNYYRGVRLGNFRISELTGSSVKVPGDAKVSASHDPSGALKAIVTIGAPTVDLKGDALDSDGEITYTLSCGENTASCNMLPGEKKSVEIAVPENGFNIIRIVPSNAFGEGIARTVRVYCGLDTPDTPRDVVGMVSEDNLSMTVSWKAPTTGLNGGYVNPDDLEYELYLQGSAGNHVLLGKTRELTYTYNYGERKQSMPFVGVRAVNRLGQFSPAYFVGDFIGQPNELPMKEEFNYTAFTYNWRSGTSSEYHGCEWNSIQSLDGLGMGDPKFIEGGMQCYNTSGAFSKGMLIATKFSTLDTPSAVVKIPYWDYPDAGNMTLLIRTSADTGEKVLATLTPQRGAAHWETWTVPLPAEALGLPWVQVNMIVDLAATQSVILDSYNVVQDVDYDFKVAALEAPYSCFVGDNATFKVTATNSGQEPGTSSMDLELLSDGNVVDSMSVKIGRTSSGNSFERVFEFPMKTEYSGSKMEVRATITGEDDEVAANNVRTVQFLLRDNVVPVVTDLKASANEDNTGVDLAWSRPDASTGDFQSFEATPAFVNATEINGWLNVDLDGLPQFAIEGQRWDGDELPSAWTVFDAEAHGTMDNDRLCPHSGNQMLIARAIAYGEGEDPLQNHDFLISPEVVPGSTVDFWLNTISADYTETVAIYWSTSRDPETFVKGRNFTKSGSETWEHVSYTLPVEARYFAIVYESWGTFAAMIDDITFSPADPSQWDIRSYDIWRVSDTGDECVAKGVEDLTHTDLTSLEKDLTYYVTVNAERGEGVYTSPRSNAAHVEASGIDDMTLNGAIGAGRGFIFVGGHEGETIEVFTADGKRVTRVASASDREEIRLDAGVYTVRVGALGTKVLVK